MYADDMVLYSEMEDGIQLMLNALANYKKLDLTVNANETKIVVFNNGGRLKDNEEWTYNGNQLEVVDEFNYFGLLLGYNGKFNRTQKRTKKRLLDH